MKKLIFALLLVTGLVFTGVAQTATATPTPTPEISTSAASDIKSARELLKQVVDKDTNGNNKTFADVLDKGIDLFASYASSIGSVLKSIAPEVYRIMVRQQYAVAISSIIYWLAIPMVLLWFPSAFRKFRYGAKASEYQNLYAYTDDDYEDVRVILSYIAYIGFGILAVAGAYQITEAITVLINPEYYAIKDMLNMIKN